mgnify:CR=1 FL=1
MIEICIRHEVPGFALTCDFTAPAGVTCLFGHSGSGKTTVVNAVAGLLRPDAARISVNGRMLEDSGAGLWLPPHQRRIGYGFQDARLFPHMTVAGNLAYGMPKEPKGAAWDRVIGMLGIEALLERKPRSLSGGEQQRVAIGRALLSGPDLLLMDEPLAALDGPRKDEILPYLERLRDEVHIPILYVSHAVSEVARLATTVVLLERGRVVRAGPVSEIFADPALVPILGARDAGAVLEARIVRHHDDGLTELSCAGGTLWLPQVNGAEGSGLRVRISASEVMLAKERPEGISALNVLEGVVSAIRIGEGPGAVVQLQVGDGQLLARITRRSAEAMGLVVGARIFAVAKSVAVARADVGAGVR